MVWETFAAAALPTVLGSLMGGNDGASTSQSSQANPFQSSSGLFNTNWNGNNLSLGYNQQLQDMQGLMGAQALSQTGLQAPQYQQSQQLGSDFLSGLSAYDPYQLAQQQYGLLSPMLQQQQQQAGLNLENRQFAQGRLGSTGGAQELGQFNLSNQLANNSLMNQSFTQGLAGQQQQANLGIGFSQFAPQLQNMYNTMPSGLLSQMQGIDAAALQQAQIAGGLGGATSTGSGGYSNTQQFGQGLMSSGLQQFTNGLNGLFTPQPGGTYIPGTGPSGRP